MPPLTTISRGDVFLPFNYIEEGLSGILEQVRGTAYAIDVHATGAGAQFGVVLFLADDPELQACLRLLPRYDMGLISCFSALYSHEIISRLARLAICTLLTTT